MGIILLTILLIICFACFVEGKVNRKGVRLTLSISIAFLFVLIMEAASYSLIMSGKLEGYLLVLAYFVLPIVSFSALQLLLYQIELIKKS